MENTESIINNYEQIDKINLKKLRRLKPDSVTDRKGTINRWTQHWGSGDEQVMRSDEWDDDKASKRWQDEEDMGRTMSKLQMTFRSRQAG